MAERFNLTAQIQLQAPTNTAQVVGQIKQQLKGINIDVKVKANAPQVAKLNKELQGVSKAGDASAKSIGRMNASLGQAARRFSVITVATGSFLALARAIKNAAGDAIAFERELLKISQVTGKSVSQLQSLTKEVTRLSTSLGASSSDLLNVSRTLSQAGFNATKTKQALETLAQTTLAATFDNIKDTTEGAIAVLRQFSAESRASGGDIKFLASTMDAINSVSKRFAVESGDLITAIRRVGGVFSSAGGKVNELIALFTSVRATTRESAETIATGLRTIFTRLQRTDTVDQLKQLGIELRNSQGQFVGAYEAVRRLSTGLSSLDPRDFRFSEIVESLGGFRQVGKVIPLIQQFTIAQNALNVAQGASGSVAKDAEIAQQGLGNQIAKVRQDFEALMRQFADTSTFRSLVTGALELAKAFIQIAKSLEPILPLLTTMIGLKIGKSLAPALGGLIGGGQRRNQGGKIHAFARGGHVPGTGNRDTVPAMLSPGEFVIKKSSAAKLGSSTLEAMNNNGFNAGGGVVATGKHFYGPRPPGVNTIARTLGLTSAQVRAGNREELQTRTAKVLNRKKVATGKGAEQRADSVISGGNLSSRFGVSFLKGSTPNISASLRQIRKESGARGKQVLDSSVLKAAKRKNPDDQIDNANQAFDRFVARGAMLKTKGTPTFLQKKGSDIFEDEIMGGLPKLFSKATKAFRGTELNPGNVPINQLLSTSALGAIEGQFFEAFVRRITNNVIKDPSKDEVFDFKSLTSPDLKTLFGKQPFVLPNEFKNSANSANIASAIGKALTLGNNPRLLASGGGISGSDTVPAMLTPGEYVINKSAAQSIGYSALGKMNKTGVKGYAAGGVVTQGRHFYGLGHPGTFDAMSTDFVDKSATSLSNALDEAGKSTLTFGQRTANAANAAQNFVFLGSAVTTLTSQFSGMSDQTKQVVNETAGFATAMVGIVGTIVQLATSLGGVRAASDVAGAVGDAVQDNVCCDDGGGGGGGERIGRGGRNKGKKLSFTGKDKAIKMGAAPKSKAGFGRKALTGLTRSFPKARKGISLLGKTAGFVGKRLTGIVGTLASVGIGLKAYNTNLRLGAEAAAKKNEADIAGLRTGESNITAAGLEKGILKEIESRERQDAVSTTEKFAMVGTTTLAGAAGGGKLGSMGGAAVGSLFPGAGTAIGGGVGGFIGAGIGGSAGFKGGMEAVRALEESRIAASAKAREEEIARVRATISNLITLEKSFKSFDDEIAAIDMANLKPEKALQQKLDATQKQLDIGAGDTVITESRNIQGLLDRVNELAPGAMAGKEASGENIREALKGTQTLGFGGVDNAQIEGIIGQFEMAQRTQQSAIEKTAQIREAASKNFSTALTQIDPTKTFEEVMAAGTPLKQAYDQQRAAIEASQKAIIQEGSERTNKLRDKVGTGEATEDDVAASQQQTIAQVEALNKEMQQLETTVRATTNANEYMMMKQEEAAQAQTELNQKMNEAARVMNTFIALEAGLQKYEQSLSNLSAVMSNAQFDFSMPEIAGLQDLNRVGDRQQFGADVRKIAGSDSALNEAADEVLRTADQISTVRTELSARTGASIAMAAGPDDDTQVVDTKAFLKDLGIEEGDVSGDVFKKIEKILTESAKNAGDVIPVDAIAKVLEEGAASSQELLNARRSLENKEIAAYQKYVNAIASVRDRDVASAVANVSAENRAADMMAKARGKEVSLADKDRGRTRAAQTALAGVRDPIGRQVQAGNIDQVLNTRLAAETRRAQIDEERKTATGTKAQELIAEENKLADVVKRTTAELGRLSDQSGKAAEIMSEIEKAGRGRKQLGSMATSFAFGSDDARRSMGQNLASTRMAIGSMRMGRGLQGATEEQRAGVASVLDQLSDFEFDVGGGKVKSGREIKAELAAQEVLRTTGDKRAAAAIRGEVMKGSKEEQLIKSLDNLAKEIVEATKAQGTRFTPNFQPPPGLDGDAPSTTTGLPTSSQQAMQDTRSRVAGMSDAEVLNESRDRKLAELDRREEEAKRKGAGLGRVRQDRREFLKQQEIDKQKFLRGELGQRAIDRERRAIETRELRKTEKLISSLDRLAEAVTDPVASMDLTTMQLYRAPQQRANGGLIYRADGGSIFQPKGTDTVPAMLTPGEFVIKKSSVDQIGVGNLQALNDGVQYHQDGGVVQYLANGEKVEFVQDPRYPDRQILDQGTPIEGSVTIASQSRAKIAEPNDDLLANMRTEDDQRKAQLNAEIQQRRKEQAASEAEAIRQQREKSAKQTQDLRNRMADVRKKRAAEKAKREEEAAMPSLQSSEIPYDPVMDSAAIETAFILAPEKQDTRLAPKGGSRYVDKRSGKSYLERRAEDRARAKKEYEEKKYGKIVEGKKGDTTALDMNPNSMLSSDPDILPKLEGGQYNPNKRFVGPKEQERNEGAKESREAVQSHGVGYMKSLNRGRVPGFRRGGVVGTGNVQHRNMGSRGIESIQRPSDILSLDASDLGNVLKGFNSGLVTELDNVIKKFTGFSEAFTRLSESFTTLRMEHTFKGDMTLAFHITNADVIKNTVAEEITPKIAQIITAELNTRLDQDFRIA